MNLTVAKGLENDLQLLNVEKKLAGMRVGKAKEGDKKTIFGRPSTFRSGKFVVDKPGEGGGDEGEGEAKAPMSREQQDASDLQDDIDAIDSQIDDKIDIISSIDEQLDRPQSPARANALKGRKRKLENQVDALESQLEDLEEGVDAPDAGGGGREDITPGGEDFTPSDPEDITPGGEDFTPEPPRGGGEQEDFGEPLGPGESEDQGFQSGEEQGRIAEEILKLSPEDQEFAEDNFDPEDLDGMDSGDIKEAIELLKEDDAGGGAGQFGPQQPIADRIQALDPEMQGQLIRFYEQDDQGDLNDNIATILANEDEEELLENIGDLERGGSF